MTSFAYMSDSRFLGAAPSGAGRPFAVAGLPWDGAVTNRPGARFAPKAIRQASHMLCDATHPFFGVSPVALLEDAGDLPLPNTSLAAMREAMAGPVEVGHQRKGPGHGERATRSEDPDGCQPDCGRVGD